MAAAPKQFLFASESVSRGHPDKCCDQISDAILDACLQVDEHSRVAVETTVKGNFVGLFGEVTTKAPVNYENIVRKTLREIGYSKEGCDIDPNTCVVMVNIRGQESQIADIVHAHQRATKDELGAGDQGLMFGYATDETEQKMPMSLFLAHEIHRILRQAFDAAQEQIHHLEVATGRTREDMEAALPLKGEDAQLLNGKCNGGASAAAAADKRPTRSLCDIPFWWLRPDAKSQVVVAYQENAGAMVPLAAKVAVLSVQHSKKCSVDEFEETLKEVIIKPALAAHGMLADDTVFIINGKQKLAKSEWTVGGPNADAGTTGRKIIVDTYGGHGAHGGGAFSGKDPSKVDRSAAYYCRFVAKSLVSAHLCKRVLVQVSYVIGKPEPLNVYVSSYGTGVVSDDALLQIVLANFDFRPGYIIEELGLLKKVKYLDTAYHGHFGRDEFPWEQPKPLVLPA